MSKDEQNRPEKRYSDAEARDRELKAYIQSATEVDYESPGYLGRLKDHFIGRKSRYEFACRTCDNTFITQEKYLAQESSVVSGARWRMRYRIKRALATMARDIPYLGQFVAGGIMGTPRIEETSAAVKGKTEAFQSEVAHQIHRCRECGSFVCHNCFSDGLCKNCVKPKENQHAAAPALGGTAPTGNRVANTEQPALPKETTPGE